MTDDLETWKRGRLAALTADDGWLVVTDRVVLRMGAQTVGSAHGNDIVIR